MAYNRFWQAISQQLIKPSDFLGQMTGRAMRLVNAKANRLALEVLAQAKPATVLEVGCGPGLGIYALAAADYTREVTGLDWSDTMIAATRKYTAKLSQTKRINLVTSSFEILPFNEASFNAVLAVNAAYFMVGSQAISEIYRVLSPGGFCVVSVIDKHHMQKFPFATTHSHRHFDTTDLISFLESGGFESRAITIKPINAGGGVKGLIATAIKSPLEQ